MGLTIHYHIVAGREWTRRQIREKLEDTRRFALSLSQLSAVHLETAEGPRARLVQRLSGHVVRRL